MYQFEYYESSEYHMIISKVVYIRNKEIQNEYTLVGFLIQVSLWMGSWWIPWNILGELDLFKDKHSWMIGYIWYLALKHDLVIIQIWNEGWVY